MEISNNVDRTHTPITALRLKRRDDDGISTAGTLTLEGGQYPAGTHNNPVMLTLELPWRGNMRGVSRIPEGEYEIVRKTSGRYFACYRKRWQHSFSIEIANVPKRSAILIHSGNYPHHTRGCVLVGEQAGKECVLKSRDAYQRVYNHLTDLFEPGYRPYIHITDCEVQDDE